MIRYKNNTNICVRRDIIPFVGINILITQMNWILLMQVHKIRSGFGSEFTLRSVFGTMAMWSYGIWAYFMIPISESWSLKLWSRNGDKLFHSLNLLRDISLIWGMVCTLLDKINTWFSHISSFLVILSLSMLLMTTMLLFLYIPVQGVQIHWRLICRMRRWLILWEMICWRQWNEKMLIYGMTLVLDLGRNMKWTMTLNLCLINLKKKTEINYTYGSHPSIH